MKKIIAILLLLLLPCGALAESYVGATEAIRERTLLCEADGTVETLKVTAGDKVSAEEEWLTYALEKVFATQNGTVAKIKAESGAYVTDTVLEITPQQKYLVYCTSANAHEAADTQFIHMGETVYLRCTEDGTHRAVAFVSKIEGKTYQVLTTGGELFVGETVYLYRSNRFRSDECVGKGTVVSSSNESYSCNGYLATVNVTEGQTVERGQLLYTYTAAKSNPSSDVEGIITSLNVEQGGSLHAGDVIGQVAALEDIWVKITVPASEISLFAKGKTVTLVYADDSDNEQSGTVERISALQEDDSYTVWIRPGEVKPVIGITTEVLVK